MLNKRKFSYGRQSISISDMWCVLKTLKSSFLTQGPKIKEFEDLICRYTGAKYAVVVSSGTAALHLAILSLDLPKNSEVITSPISFLASSNCALYAGLDVDFADVKDSTICIDPVEIEKRIKSNTKAIIPIHFAGNPCEMEEIYKICRNNNLYIIEDAAHAIGSKYKNVPIGACQFSDLTIFSFHPVKTITTCEGGAITTNNKDLYERLIMLRSHGITRKTDELISKNTNSPWYYEMQLLGYNYRLSDIQAALGINQLKRIKSFISKRQLIAEKYDLAFTGIDMLQTISPKHYSDIALHLYILKIDFERLKKDRSRVMSELSQRGITTQVHFIPIHTQPYYQKCFNFQWGDYPIAEDYYQKALTIPLYPDSSVSDVDYIIKSILEVVK